MPPSFTKLAQFATLTAEQKAELQKLSTRGYNVVKSTGKNLKDLKKKIYNILHHSLLELSKTEQIDIEAIERLFNDTIGKAQDALLETIEDAYKEQLETTDIFIFDGVVAEKVLSILKKILEFEKKLDELYGEGTSKKIIESLETLLVAVISTQLPLVGTFIELSGMMGILNDFIDVKNLLPKVKEWHEQIQIMQGKTTNIKEDKKLGDIYQKAEKTAEIAEKIEIAPQQIASLNLNKDSLDKANNEVKDNTKNKDSLKKVIEVAAELPISKKEVEEKISKIKNDLEGAVSEGLSSNKLADAQKTISDNLTQATAELAKVINPQTPFTEKLASCANAANNVKEIGKKLKKLLETSPNGKPVVATVEIAIKKGVEAIIPKEITMLKDVTPVVKNIIGISQAILAVISKAEIPSQSRGKS